MRSIGPRVGQETTPQVPSLITKWSSFLDKNEPSCVLLAVEICRNLQKEKKFAVLEMFLNALPESDNYSKNEQIVRAKISVAYESKNFCVVYDLIKSNKFQNGQDLINLWDSAHYAEEFERSKKTLTALNRFRIRKRYQPPNTICPEGERKKATLTQTSKDILQQWFDENKTDPYPSKETKEYLSRKANLTVEQVKTWFANARRRLSHAQGKENRHWSWKRYQKKKENSGCYENLGLRQSSNNFQPKVPITDEQNDVLSGKQDEFTCEFEGNASHSTLSCNFEQTSILSPISSFLSPSYIERNRSGNSKISFHDVSGMELVESFVVNPSLYPPSPVTYFYDFYSLYPFPRSFTYPCVPPFYQPYSSSFYNGFQQAIPSDGTLLSNNCEGYVFCSCGCPSALKRYRVAPYYC